MRLAVAKTKGKTDANPVTTQVEGLHGLKDFLVKNSHPVKDQAGCWMPTTFKPGQPKRNAKSIDTVTCLVIDVDEGLTYIQAKNRLQETKVPALIHRSHSDQIEKQEKPACDRFRVIIPFAKPVDAEAWKSIYLALVNRVLASASFDQANLDASRQWFFPKSQEVEALNPHGDYLDASDFFPVTMPPTLPAHTNNSIRAIFDRHFSFEHLVNFLQEANFHNPYRTLDQVRLCRPGKEDGGTSVTVNQGEDSAYVNVFSDSIKYLKDGKGYGPFEVVKQIKFQGNSRETEQFAKQWLEDQGLSSADQTAKSWAIEHAIKWNDLLQLTEPDIAWVVDNLIPADSLTMIVAKPKVGKSSLAHDLAACVATGRAFLGRPTIAGAVGYISLEDRLTAVRGRLKSLGLPEGANFHFWKEWCPQEAADAIREAIQYFKLSLLVVDNIGRLENLDDGNSYTEVTKMLGALDAVSRDTKCAIVFTHHAKKGESTNGDAALGSTAYFGIVATLISLVKKQDGKRVISTDQRYGESLEESHLERLEDLSFILSGSTSDSTREALAAKILAHVGQHPGCSHKDLLNLAGSTEGISKLIRALVEDDKSINRKGAGRSGSPYTYTLVQPPLDLVG